MNDDFFDSNFQLDSDITNELEDDYQDEDLDSDAASDSASSIDSLVSVSVSDDKMLVKINLSPSLDDRDLCVADVLKLLRHNDVTQGIDKKLIHEIIANKRYYEDFIVARGKDATDGMDGFFDYHFRTDMPTLPKVLDDGSVDYKNMDLFEEVKANQVLVNYIEATPGEFGYTVKGDLLKPKRGRDLQQLRGEGFTLLEDKTTYISNMDGIVTLEDNRLNVTRLFIVHGDLSPQTGNVNFIGDVYIMGNVLAGYKVEAGGNIMIDGHVEAAEITAGKDVLIKRGVQGNNEAHINAKGNVNGLFFESVIINAQGNVSASYFLNCTVSTDSKVVVAGRRGIIIGGMTKAKQGIDCFGIGNIAEIPTEVTVGIDKEQMLLHQSIGKKLMKVDYDIKLIEEGIQKVSHTKVRDDNTKAMYRKLTQAYKIKADEKKKLLKERNKLMQLMDSSSHAKVIVKGIVYPGVKVVIDTNPYKVMDAIKDVVFVRQGSKVVATGE